MSEEEYWYKNFENRRGGVCRSYSFIRNNEKKYWYFLAKWHHWYFLAKRRWYFLAKRHRTPAQLKNFVAEKFCGPFYQIFLQYACKSQIKKKTTIEKLQKQNINLQTGATRLIEENAAQSKSVNYVSLLFLRFNFLILSHEHCKQRKINYW